MEDKEWYKTAVIYGMDVETFFDADGDGSGDFKGATAKLDYLSWLGITCIWLLPFYPTSNRDNGYDVINYTNVDQRLGTLEDFRSFIAEAKKRGIRIIIDLVLHHTSDEHPWFIAATADKNSQYHDYYIWTEQLPPKPHGENVFPTEEPDVWHYDEHARKYYHHKFYHFEPDLNIANTKVQEELYKIIDFWLSFDIDGFRVDAATHMFERKGIPGTEIENPGEFITTLRSFIQMKKPETILLAEADVDPEKIKIYFGDNDRFQLLFNFLLNNNLFLSLARKNALAIIDRLRSIESVSTKGQWANFIRNLDELDLERLTNNERQDVYEAFAPNPSMRVYNRGIRRRIAPMMDGEITRLKMIFTLLFSLPGSPLFVYGDEIGMGENLNLKERTAVRTPMQWSSKKNAGFSTSSKDKLIRQVISQGEFRYETVNVTKEEKDPSSLLLFMRQLITLYKENPEIGTSPYRLIDTNQPEIIAIKHSGEKKNLVTLINFSDREVSLKMNKIPGKIKDEILKDSSYKKSEHIHLAPYGFRWFITSE